MEVEDLHPRQALVLKLLYPLSKRYYVEHLLFVIHFHAFVFLILTLQVLFARKVIQGDSVELTESVHLVNLPENVSAVRTLRAPRGAAADFRFVFADGLAPPVKNGAFDTVVTPWSGRSTGSETSAPKPAR